MAKRSPVQQLDEAVEAIMADRDAPPIDASVAALLHIAADLRDLPREDFRARLKRELQEGRATGGAQQAPPRPSRSATPYLIVKDAAGAIDFYKRAFGAVELMEPMMGPGGKIVHAEFKVGDSAIMIADETPEFGNLSPQSLGGTPVIIALQVEDVDALATNAVAAGAKVVIPIADQFYGDRAGRLADPFGHLWIVSTHKEDVPPDELERRLQAFTRQADAAAAVKPVREGFRALTPYLQVHGAAELIDFVKQAFAAEEILRITRPDGIAHAEVKIGDSMLEMADASDEFPPTPTAIHLYVDDADATYARALRAGATSMGAPTNQDYGDREASVRDRFGNNWYIATHLGKDPSGRPMRIPEGLHAITPYLHPRGAPQLIDFLTQAFGAEEAFRAQSPDGTVVHAKIRIGDSMLEMGEAHGPYQPMPPALHLYVGNTDTVYERALRAGAQSLFPPANQPYGDRIAGVKDPFDNVWYIATHVEDVTPADMQKRDEDLVQQQAAAKSIPEGFHAVTPLLQVRDVGRAIDFLKQAFGAEQLMLAVGGDPPHTHGEVRIGDSVVMLGDGSEPMEASIYLYVPDVDVVYQRALRAGAVSLRGPTDQAYGDRNAGVKDPFGNVWWIATHLKNVPH